MLVPSSTSSFTFADLFPHYYPLLLLLSLLPLLSILIAGMINNGNFQYPTFNFY